MPVFQKTYRGHDIYYYSPGEYPGYQDDGYATPAIARLYAYLPDLESAIRSITQPVITSVTISAPSSAEEGVSFTISGTVKDQFGVGVGGASVTLFVIGSEVATVSTNSAGGYSRSISISGTGIYELAAEADTKRAYTDITITTPEETGRVYVETYREIDIYYNPTADMYYYTVEGVEHYQPTLEQARTHIDTLLATGWKLIEVYRGIRIWLYQTVGEYWGYYFNPTTGQQGPYSTLQGCRNAIDAFLEPEPPAQYVVGVGLYDGENSKYVPSTIIVDGIRYAISTYEVLNLEEGVHRFDLEVPADYDWVKWIIIRWSTGEILSEPTGRSISWNVVEDTFLQGVIQLAIVNVPTTTTISAPSEAAVNERFNISGILYESEAGIPIPNQPINHSYNGRSLGSSTTGVDGNYLKEISIPESGTWTIKSEFPGAEALQTSRALVDAVVGAPPIETALLIAGPIVTGLALVIYGSR